MKKNFVIVLVFALAALLFVSCSSSDVKIYSAFGPKSEKIYIQYVTGTTNVTETGYWYSSYDKQSHPYVYSESLNLSTVENRELVKSAFMAKGYRVVQDTEADSIVMVENKSDASYSRVSIAVYDKATQQLLFVCNGEYDTFLGTAQYALEKALNQALSQIVPYTAR